MRAPWWWATPRRSGQDRDGGCMGLGPLVCWGHDLLKQAAAGGPPGRCVPVLDTAYCRAPGQPTHLPRSAPCCLPADERRELRVRRARVAR